jgi:hypothetical protein
MACLDENTVAAYFDLAFSPKATAQLFEHVDACAACAQLFATVAAAHLA